MDLCDVGPGVQPLQRASGRSSPTSRRARRRSSCTTTATGSGKAIDSIVSNGVIVSGASVRESVLSPGVHLHSWASVERSVLMDGVDVGRRAVVRNAILDKNVQCRARRGDRRRQGRGPGPWIRRVAERRHRDRQGRGGAEVSGPADDAADRLKVALLTREYPPEVYGGAGVHVEYLARELAPFVDLTVHCQGKPRSTAVGAQPVEPAVGGELRPADALDGPVDGRRARRLPARALPHLVREPGRAHRRAAARDPACRHHALAGASAAVEGRAARRRLRALVVGGEGVDRGRGRGHRRVGRDARGRSVELSGRRPGQGARRSTTASTPSSTPPTRPPTSSSATASTPSKPSVVFVGRITRQKGVPVAAAGGGAPRPGGPARAVRGRSGHARAGRGGRGSGRGAAQDPLGRHLALGDAQQAGGHPAAVALDALRLPVGLRTAGDRQPGGHGLRDGRRRVQGRRHPRGGRGRGDRAAGAPGRPGRPRRVDQRADPRPRPGEGDGRRGPRARAVAVRLGQDRAGRPRSCTVDRRRLRQVSGPPRVW